MIYDCDRPVNTCAAFIFIPLSAQGPEAEAGLRPQSCPEQWQRPQHHGTLEEHRRRSPAWHGRCGGIWARSGGCESSTRTTATHVHAAVPRGFSGTVSSEERTRLFMPTTSGWKVRNPFLSSGAITARGATAPFFSDSMEQTAGEAGPRQVTVRADTAWRAAIRPIVAASSCWSKYRVDVLPRLKLGFLPQAVAATAVVLQRPWDRKGAVNGAPRRRRRGEQFRISQASKAWGLRGLSLGSAGGADLVPSARV